MSALNGTNDCADAIQIQSAGSSGGATTHAVRWSPRLATRQWRGPVLTKCSARHWAGLWQGFILPLSGPGGTRLGGETILRPGLILQNLSRQGGCSLGC
jgi:hypothetical protein